MFEFLPIHGSSKRVWAPCQAFKNCVEKQSDFMFFFKLVTEMLESDFPSPLKFHIFVTDPADNCSFWIPNKSWETKITLFTKVSLDSISQDCQPCRTDYYLNFISAFKKLSMNKIRNMFWGANFPSSTRDNKVKSEKDKVITTIFS